jgi:hypothetical protein
MRVLLGTSKELTVMLSHLMPRKPRAELQIAARPACAASLPSGQARGWGASGQPESGSAAISHRLDCQLASQEALQ